MNWGHVSFHRLLKMASQTDKTHRRGKTRRGVWIDHRPQSNANYDASGQTLRYAALRRPADLANAPGYSIIASDCTRLIAIKQCPLETSPELTGPPAWHGRGHGCQHGRQRAAAARSAKSQDRRLLAACLINTHAVNFKGSVLMCSFRHLRINLHQTYG